MSDWTGKEISHYRVISQLGQGGMGVVYLAEDLNIGRRVVLKLLKADLAADPRMEERFHREARACAAIVHPNITTIYEVSRHGGLWYICMEFVEGETLRTVLRDRRTLPVAEAVRIAAGVAEALGAAHQRGIVHRDMKPENIMVTPSGQVKVLDFGLAAFTNALLQPLDVGALETGVERLTTQGLAIGTLHYMSPEQTRGRTVTPASDVFSLAGVLYEMLTGIPPFRGDNSLAVMHAIAYDHPPALSTRRADVHPDLEQVIRRALRKEPDQRQVSGQVLHLDLMRVLRLMEQTSERPTDPSIPAAPPIPPEHQDTRETTRQFPSDLVGRDREMKLLRNRLDQALTGEGGLILVAGEAGIGKTRLVTELARLGEQRGVRYLHGRCLFREGGLPYHPFVEAAERLVACLGLDDAQALESYVRERMPSLVGRLPILKSFLHVPGHESTALISDKEHLLDAISALFLAFARERPMILLIDDLHWADEATIDLLLYLARNCGQSQGLVIGTYRPEELTPTSAATHPLGRLLERMGAGDLYTEIHLSRLGADETAAVVAGALKGARLPPELIDRLYSETAGNPFYVLETLKLLTEDGTLERSDGRWRLAQSPERVSIPGRVHDVVMRRLSRVAATDRELLEVAACEGMVFHSDSIARCLEVPRLRVLGALQRAEKEHRLIHSEHEGYIFDHPLIREILYEAIIPELRREYHRLMGDVLTSTRRGRPGEEAAIAWQYLEAGQEEAALPFLLDAGDRARSLYANAEALSLLNRAETILTRLRDERRARDGGLPADLVLGSIRLYKERGRLHQRLGDHDRAMSDFLAMQRAATDAGLADRQAHALSRMADLYYAMGEYDQSFETSRLAHDLAERAGDRKTVSHALRAMGAVHFYRAEYEEALIAHNRSIEIEKEIGDLSGWAENMNKVGNIHLFRGDREEAERVYQAALELGRRSGNKLSESESLNNLGVLHYYGGEAQSALSYFEQCLALKREIGDKRSLARSLGNLALVFEMRGELEAAVSTRLESLSLIRTINDQGSLPAGLNNLANVYEKMGRYQEALEACEESLSMSQAIGDRWGTPYALNSLGRVKVGLNRPAEAEELFQRALAMTRQHRQRVDECFSLQNLGLARAELGRTQEALETLQQARELAREIKARERESEIVYLIGSLQAARGDAAAVEACGRDLGELARLLGLKEAEIMRGHLEGLTASLQGRIEDAARILGESAGLASQVGLREMEWRLRADRAEILPPGMGKDDEIGRAAGIIQWLAQQAGPADERSTYLAHPRRRLILQRASEIHPSHDDSNAKMTDS